MKLRTSFSNLTTFKKNITRFAPLWALYLIGTLLVLFDINHGSYDRFARNVLPGVLASFGVVNMIYAGVCAMMLFGDLYNTRMCYSLHTTPMRREGLFLSHCASAFCFSIGPNILVAFLLMLHLESYWFLALYWLLASTLQFTFFFGIASVAAMLTGNRFAMLLVYAGINFVSVLALWIVSVIFMPLMTGVILDRSPFYLLCPVVQIFRDFTFFEFERVELPSVKPSTDDMYIVEDYFYQYIGLGTGWGYLAAIAVVGLVAAGLALLLYRMRHLESAGDFVAFPKLKGVACVVMTLCVGGVFAFFGNDMLGDSMLLWLIVGLVIGFFGSLMLLERRIKVFRVKTFISFVILVLVLTACYLTVYFDVFNVVHWTPKTSNVQSVTITNAYVNNNSLWDDDLYWEKNNLSATLTDPEQIELAITAHEDILDRLEEPQLAAVHRVTFRYTLKNGRTVIRTYRAPASGENYQIIRSFLYTPQSILGYNDWDEYVRNMETIYIDGWELDPMHFGAFLTALRKDCELGHANAPGDKGGTHYIDLNFRTEGNRNQSRTVFLTEQAHSALAFLKKPEVVLGYTDWEDYLAQEKQIFIKGFEIPATYQAELLEAIKVDCQAGAIEFNYSEWSIFEVEIMGSYHNNYRVLSITKDASRTLQWLEEHSDLLEK